MKISRQDRNTGLIIVVVLIVCTISLIAVGSYLVQLVRPGVEAVANALGAQVRTSSVNYNFVVPPAEGKQEMPTPTPAEDTVEEVQHPTGVNYNFPVPAPYPEETPDNVLAGFEDAILDDAKLAGYGAGTDTPQINLKIRIPKINVNSPVIQGLGGDDLLRKGFWVYPTSYGIGKGETVLLCHRRYFGPNDPRSCWYLDQVEQGDEIFIRSESEEAVYKVIGVNVFDAGDPVVYKTSSTEDYLKIVTCTPLGSSAQRLVVLAKRVG